MTTTTSPTTDDPAHRATTDDPARRATRDDPAPGPARRARTALRLDHTRELLTLLPYQLGFHPHASVVLVALRRPGRSVGLMARLDLPDVLAPEGADLVADAVGHLEADGAREVVVVVYGDEREPRDPARGLRVRPGVPAVRAAEVARRAGAALGPVTVWHVADGRYLGLDCRDRGCCPPGGRALTELSGGELAGRLAGRGEVAPTRADVGAIPPAAAGARRSAAGARARWLDTLLRAPDSTAVLRWRQQSLDGWRAALACLAADPGSQVTAATLGRVEAGLLDPVVRDAVLLTLVGAGAGLPDALLRIAPDAFGGRGRGDGGDAARSGRGGEAAHGGPYGPGGDDGVDPGGRTGSADGTCAGSAVERAGEALVRHPEDDHGPDDRDRSGRCREGRDPDDRDPGPDDPDPDDRDPDDRDPDDRDPVDRDPDDRDPVDRDRDDRDPDDRDPVDRDRGDRDPGGRRGSADPGAAGRDEARAVSARVRDALDLMVDPVRGREPDDALADAARTVLERVVAHGRRGRQAPALTVLALLAWWGGDAVRASVLVERALDDDPGHRLADLLDRALGHGLPPGWLRRRC